MHDQIALFLWMACAFDALDFLASVVVLAGLLMPARSNAGAWLGGSGDVD